jgi:hypothetical protein
VRLGAVLLLAAVTGLLGFAIVHDGSGAQTGEHSTRTAATSAFEVSLPANWRRGTRAAAKPTLQLNEPLVLISPYPDSGLLIGAPAATGTSLLPASFLATLTAVSTREAVELGGAAFYRFRDVEPRGAGNLQTVYAQPTTAGVLLAECALGTTHTTLVSAQCERVLASLRLNGAKPLPLGLQPTYVLLLSKALSELNGARVSGAKQLADARTPRTQASAAENLARAYERASASLSKASPGPLELAANASILRALESAGHGYAATAAGARTDSRRAFDSGRRTVAGATKALAAALSQLSHLS